MVQERDREQSSNTNTSFARFRYNNAANIPGDSRQVENTRSEINI